MIPNPENSPTADLFGSKSLDLVWLTAAYGSPCSLPVEEKSARWYWRIDVVFGGWLVGRLRIAKSRSVELHAGEVQRAQIVRNYLEEQRAGAWEECKRLADGGSVQLPGVNDLVSDLSYLIRFGVLSVPEVLRAMVVSADSEVVAPPDASPPVEVPPTRPRQTRRPTRRSDATADLF